MKIPKNINKIYVCLPSKVDYCTNATANIYFIILSEMITLKSNQYEKQQK